MNIAEILKDAPRGTKLYSPIFGDVILNKVSKFNIEVLDTANNIQHFIYTGLYNINGECMLFPSRENRVWNDFSLKKFDINTLKPFDKVLVRDSAIYKWTCNFYSYYRIDRDHYKYVCISDSYHQCIPYNDETKHLVGTDKDCPEYYKTW